MLLHLESPFYQYALRCHELVSWRLTFVATKNAGSTGCHELVSWRLTFVATKNAGSTGCHELVSWRLTFVATISSEREAPRHKAGASGASRRFL
jgi:hypothetical protein